MKVEGLHQTLLGLNVTDPTPGIEVFAISVKSAVSWAISTLGNATTVADDNDEYPSYVSDLVAALYGGGVVVSDPVRAASLSQQHLVTKQIHSVIEQAKLGTMTKRRRDEVEYTHHQGCGCGRVHLFRPQRHCIQPVRD